MRIYRSNVIILLNYSIQICDNNHIPNNYCITDIIE